MVLGVSLGILCFGAIAAVRNGVLHEIKSPLILQPGPAALTDGLAALEAIIAAS
jgi:iron complex transport system substrate-binding protein